MSIIIELSNGAERAVAVDADGSVGAAIDAIADAAGLTCAVGDYNIVVAGADEVALGDMDAARPLGDAGVFGCEERVRVRVKQEVVAREALAGRGITTAADVADAVRAAVAARDEPALDTLRLIRTARLAEATVGQTLAGALFTAVGHRDVVAAEWLVAHASAPVNAATDTDATPLWCAAANNDAAMVDALLRHSADPDAPDADGSTPLYEAAQGGHLDVVRALLAGGAAASVEDEIGRTPLWVAARHGREAVVAALVAAGADADAQDCDGYTAVWTAAQQGHRAIVDMLLTAGADPDRASTTGIGPLHAAACHDYVDVARTLLRHGADVDALDVSEAAPLASAAANGSVELVELLLAHGADVARRDECGRGALDLAREGGVRRVLAAAAAERAGTAN